MIGFCEKWWMTAARRPVAPACAAAGLSLILGIALVALPEAEAAHITWAVGWFGLACGGALVLVAARLRRLALAAWPAPRR